MEQLASESISLLAKPSRDRDGQRLGSFGAVFIMLKSALGAGLLNFPWAFARAGGIRYAVAVEMLCVIFLISALVILGYSSSISGQSSYQAVVQDLCGPVVGKLCAIFFVFNLFMISVAFLVILADQLQKLSESIYELIHGSSESEMSHHWYTDQRFTLFILCFFLILPLSIPKEIWTQKYTSVLGTLAATYLTVAVTVKYYIRAESEHSLSPVYSSGSSSWAPVFSVIPTICYGFQCHEASIAIYSSLENKTLSHWVLISSVSIFFCTVLYSLTGIYGYLTFGKNVAADILMSYSGDDVIIIIARLLFGVSIITIYPIVLLLGRSVIQAPLLCLRGKHIIVTPSFENFTRLALTLAWVVTTLLIAVSVPDISKVISVIGGISALFIFIFPGLCLILAMQSQPVSPTLRWALIAWGVIMLLCGSFIFGQSTSIAVMQILNKT
ncbi:putative sodium-coupled neutral amino acid transporter 8a [Brachyhypopomus gauderio]|uniref:putative sodium-coupled neutral amino acid transporter 8a n=1 Tax=Brachyhypopomus gauderio TaxID=698409 RepID=UPI0040415A2B